jgi:hypothetical protein
MTYSIFNRDSGNLIDSFQSERRAFEMIAEMLRDEANDPESIGLIVTDRERTIRTYSGYELSVVVGAEAGQQQLTA